jgi:hypothetical protein
VGSVEVGEWQAHVRVVLAARGGPSTRTPTQRSNRELGSAGWVLLQTEPLRCAECGREPVPDERALDDWRAYSDGLELVVFTPSTSLPAVGSRSRSSEPPTG